MDDKRQGADYFLGLLQKSRLGKFKVYIGMSAGVGKTYRMLQDAHALLKVGVDVRIGYIETHTRAETIALLDGVPMIARRSIYYKGAMMEEMDLQEIIRLHPELVIVDELAHTNVPGSKNEKRWQDVVELLNAGVNVLSAVNIQHIEGMRDAVEAITQIEVKERVPDKVLRMADEVVNIDLTADELIARLKAGKIYEPDKVAMALNHFFQPEKILQLRELALREVATQVEQKIDRDMPTKTHRSERFLACISSNSETAGRVIRKTGRLAAYYHSEWFVLYVQTPREDSGRIDLAKQRHLLNHFKLATQLGAELIQVQDEDIAKVIFETAAQKKITTVCIGKPHFNLFRVILKSAVFHRLLKVLSTTEIDIVILS